MIEIVSLLLAIFKAVPTLKTWFDGLVLAYISYADNKFSDDVASGLKTAIEKHNQIALEKTIGYSKAGEKASEGSIIVTKLPFD